ncbi:MAG: RDD family protein [Dehalococcoidia bacterium]|nr:RDD family protein [Dehalococcoidia bacterium]
MGSRTGAWLISYIAVQFITALPVVGWLLSIGAFFWTMVLYQRGQDIGARIVGLRVVRDTGELAGFFQMWVRALASMISFIVIGAGFWTAYWDRDNRTWHDKWVGTYVVKSGPEVDDLPGTSSPTAKAIFWISLVLMIILIVALMVFLATLFASLVDFDPNWGSDEQISTRSGDMPSIHNNI